MFWLWVGHERSLQLTVEPFTNPVRDRVETGCMDLLRTKQAHQIFPKEGFENGTLIRRDRERNAKPRDPMGQESFSNRFSCSNREWDSFCPTSEPINTGEDISLAMRRWERSNNVDVNSFKTLARGQEGAQGSFSVSLHLRALTSHAGADPIRYIGVNFRPHKTSCYQFA